MSNTTKVYQYGTTIRFEVEFFDFEGIAVEPDADSIKFRVYDSKYKQLTENSGVPVSGKLGQYIYDYETHRKEQRLFYEWYAEIDGKPSLKRGEFVLKFV